MFGYAIVGEKYTNENTIECTKPDGTRVLLNTFKAFQLFRSQCSVPMFTVGAPNPADLDGPLVLEFCLVFAHNFRSSPRIELGKREVALIAKAKELLGISVEPCWYPTQR